MRQVGSVEVPQSAFVADAKIRLTILYLIVKRLLNMGKSI